MYRPTHIHFDLKYCDVSHVKKGISDRFSTFTEVSQVCVHIRELQDIVNNQSTAEWTMSKR